MKKWQVISLSLGIIVLGFVGFVAYSNRPLDNEEASSHLANYFEKAAPSMSKDADDYKGFSGVQVLIDSPLKGLEEEWAFGYSDKREDHKLVVAQPFHVASVGKLFTAVLIHKDAKNGLIALEDPISKYLEPEQLANLFVFEGIDYSNKVTVAQLLAHTSGIGDYFSDPVIEASKGNETGIKPLDQQLLAEPNHFFEPQELIDFTRNHQVSVGRPGEVYHYSDSGYVLLGFILEKIHYKPFHEILEEQLFIPLGMNQSYMALRSEPLSKSVEPMADIWFKNTLVTDYQSLSVDWSGGGVISTLSDLALFTRALFTGVLIDKAQLAEMFQGLNKFESGIYTGKGGMEIHFKEFFPLLAGYPQIQGHIGILSTHLFYDVTSDTVIIMNYGSDTQMVNSFKGLIEIMTTLQRIQ